jgi:hypothetical protein
MKKCKIKATKYQPSLDEFKCPDCGCGAPVFHIYESECHDDCDKVHNSDLLVCKGILADGGHCVYERSGKSFANAVAKKAKLITCPCCLGKGMVESSTGDTDDKTA